MRTNRGRKKPSSPGQSERRVPEELVDQRKKFRRREAAEEKEQAARKKKMEMRICKGTRWRTAMQNSPTSNVADEQDGRRMGNRGGGRKSLSPSRGRRVEKKIEFLRGHRKKKRESFGRKASRISVPFGGKIQGKQAETKVAKRHSCPKNPLRDSLEFRSIPFLGRTGSSSGKVFYLEENRSPRDPV